MKKRNPVPLLLLICLLLSACGQDKLPRKISPALDQAVTAAILKENDKNYFGAACKTESHTVLGIDHGESIVTVYLMVLYRGYSSNTDGGYQLSSAGHSPVVITFDKTGDTYQLQEYWMPPAGEEQSAAIKEKFPFSLQQDALNSADYAEGQANECNGKADAFFATYATVR